MMTRKYDFRVGDAALSGRSCTPNRKRRLALTIAPHLAMVPRDEMALVFDYDPLIRHIDTLARACHYETQERLVTCIVEACAGYPQIEALDICLRKRPVLSGTGTLGVRLIVDAEGMAALRGVAV